MNDSGQGDREWKVSVQGFTEWRMKQKKPPAFNTGRRYGSSRRGFVGWQDLQGRRLADGQILGTHTFFLSLVKQLQTNRHLLASRTQRSEKNNSLNPAATSTHRGSLKPSWNASKPGGGIHLKSTPTCHSPSYVGIYIATMVIRWRLGTRRDDVPAAIFPPVRNRLNPPSRVGSASPGPARCPKRSSAPWGVIYRGT